MKQQSVVIKSNKYGITLFLDRNIPFRELLEAIAEKFRSTADFFHDARMALAFEGRRLNREEQLAVIRTIEENSSLEVLCVLEQDELKESFMKQVVEGRQAERDSGSGRFYKGTLRSGQVLESETSIIILGDVNPGATIVSKGNVVVLGNLKGIIHAGAAGNEDSFVAALNMTPMQIRIADVIARSADGPIYVKGNGTGPMIAYAEEGRIYMEPITKKVIGDIRI